MSQATATNTTSRRRFLAGTAVAVLIPTAAAAAPMGADAALVDAAAGIVVLDKTLDAFLDANDDAIADEHPEYQAMEDQRSGHLNTLSTVPAVGIAGVLAKARALQFDSVFVDVYRHQDISQSLVEDLMGGLLS